MKTEDVTITKDDLLLKGTLTVPDNAEGIVLFAHGTGSSRFSHRNQHVAAALQDAGIATLLMDFLTEQEAEIDAETGKLRSDMAMLAERLSAATSFVGGHVNSRDLPHGYFGSSTGAAVALIAAARHPKDVVALVSRGGRPDLAEEHLRVVKAPVLLIVGENDAPVLEINKEAVNKLEAPSSMEIVAGASHLFEEPGALDKVAECTVTWFRRHFG